MPHVIPLWAAEVGHLSRTAGVEVTDREIERWGREHGMRLGPLPGTPDDEMVEHYQALVPLMGQGHSADAAALELAQRGFPCIRLRDVYKRSYCHRPNPADDTELVSEPASSPAFVDIEARADADVVSLARDDSPLRPLWRVFERRVERASRVLGEQPDEVLHSLLTNGGVVIAGGAIYHPKAVAAVFDDDPDGAVNHDPRIYDRFVELCSFSADDMANFLDGVDLRWLVSFIAALRPMEDEMLRTWGITSDEEDWAGLVATVIAPPIALVLNRVAPVIPPALLESLKALGASTVNAMATKT
jgi:hypothetical protein